MTTRRLILLATLAGACAVGAAGCSEPAARTAPGPSTTAVDTSGAAGDTRLMAPGGADAAGVAQALRATADEPIAVTAYLFVYPDGTARLCEGMISGVPPRCTDPSMTVLDLPPEMVDQLPSQDGLKFSAGKVTLMGRMRDGVFHNDAELLARS